MTLKLTAATALASIAFITCFSTAGWAQTSAPKPQPTTTLPAAGATVEARAAEPAAQVAAPATQAQLPVATAPAATPTPVALVPPGYALVPIDSGAQTRYDVEYPQYQGALPPGMELPYEEGEPIPTGYRVVKQSRRGLVIAGSIVGGIGYGFAVLGATGDDFNHKSGALLVPVLGPWLMMALGGAKDEACNSNYTYDNCGSRSGLRTALVLDGMMQAAGAAMLIVGIAVPKTRLIRKDVTVSMLPMPLGKDGYGLGAVGQF